MSELEAILKGKDFVVFVDDLVICSLIFFFFLFFFENENQCYGKDAFVIHKL